MKDSNRAVPIVGYQILGVPPQEYKVGNDLLVEPVGRMGLLFVDWNLRGFNIISEEEWQKRESQYCEYANGFTTGISDTVLNVFNFKNLEENTILSPFAYCYNHLGEYLSSDATYEEMVEYSKDVVNAVITVALAKKAITSLKPKIKSSTPIPNASVSKTVIPSPESVSNTGAQFYKQGGGSNLDDFMTPHSEKHAFNPNTVSSRNKTQFGENIDVAKLREDTMLHPDNIVYDAEHNMIKYQKEYDFNISTSDTPTGSHRVFISLDSKPGKTNRNSQFPYYGGKK